MGSHRRLASRRPRRAAPWRAGVVAVSCAALLGVAVVNSAPLPAMAAAPVGPTSTAGGSVFAFGAPVLGSPAGLTLAARMVAIAATPSGRGYWLAGSDGSVFTYGDAGFHGSLGAAHLNQPIVGMAATPTGRGYWLAASDGGVFTFGDAGFHGSLGAIHLNQPIVGVAATRTGRGYWLVAADGGVFSFGDARFHGSLGAIHLNQPIVGVAATPTGRGYWLVAADGGLFSFGDARFHGSLGAVRLNEPIVGMAATSTGRGYWMVASDGGVFTFGDAGFYGSAGGRQLDQRVIGMARSGTGYWLDEGGLPFSPFTPRLVNFLNSLPETITAAVEDLHSGRVYTYNPGLALVLASTIKVAILGTMLAEAQAAGRGPTPSEQSLAVPMIEVSDNSAATALFNHVGGAPAVQAWVQSIGLTGTSVVPSWGGSTSTATDLLKLFNTFVTPNRFLTAPSRAYALQLLSHVAPFDIFGVVAGTAPGSLRAIKTGRIPALGVRNALGWVEGDGRDYLITILVQNGSDQLGEAAMDPVSSATWADFGP
jgi:hypothetical protein